MKAPTPEFERRLNWNLMMASLIEEITHSPCICGLTVRAGTVMLSSPEVEFTDTELTIRFNESSGGHEPVDGVYLSLGRGTMVRLEGSIPSLGDTFTVTLGLGHSTV